MYHRYLPMRQAPIASEAEIEAMQSKLDARVKSQSARDGISEGRVASATVQHPKTVAILEWEKPKSKDATGLYTTCKRYSCAKVTVNGKTSYELFKLVPGGGWFRSLNAGLDNFLQVQKLAQIDAEKGTP